MVGIVWPTTKAYDSLERVTTVTESDGSVVTISYGIQNERRYQKTVDPLMNASIQFSDIRENILEVQRLNSSGTVLTRARYEYNALGEMLCALDDRGTPVTVSYDLLGRKTALESPNSGRVEYSYDNASNVVRKTDSNVRAKGEAISYVYDELNRLIKTDYSRSPDVTYVYGGPEISSLNGAGRLLSVTDGTGTTSYSYGMLGEVTGKTRTIERLTGYTDPETATFAYCTNYLGQMDSITYPDGETITYRYDRGGNLSGVTGILESDYGPVVTEYVKDSAYNPRGQRTYIEYANGVRTRYEYDKDLTWQIL
ncbi:hypothetical protein WKV44_10395 [Spirochaetia bacterium 38H-sp]|uniref:YD repeat-containing protein n=1 Tax=Rarispira pelagica TaxID=3141764 RepID=A0ABU9UE47_9SPIR